MAGRVQLQATERFDRALSIHAPGTDPSFAELEPVAARLGAGGLGPAEVVERWEADLAARLGHEAALVFPTGAMAQQVALRVWCDRVGRRTVALHPHAHVEVWEDRGYAWLHGLQTRLVGERERLIALADLEAIAEPLGALLLELPQRDLGGALPDWDELAAQVDWAHGRGAVAHLDGARLWGAAQAYGREPAAVAALFDSVYVSLYKELRGYGGGALAGPADVIAEAAVWRNRQGGGTVSALYPFVVSAQLGLERRLPRMAEFAAHARVLAAAIREAPGVVAVAVDPPQTPLFHVFLPGSAEALARAAEVVAGEHGIYPFLAVRATGVPSIQRVELTIGEPAMDIAPAEAADFFAALCERAG